MSGVPGREYTALFVQVANILDRAIRVVQRLDKDYERAVRKGNLSLAFDIADEAAYITVLQNELAQVVRGKDEQDAYMDLLFEAEKRYEHARDAYFASQGIDASELP